jgi:phage terminase small subunit
MALTPRQSKFVDEYLIDLNASQAAIRAGYSRRGVNSVAAKLLANTSIAAEIARRQAARATRTGITAERVLEEVARLAFADPRRLYDAAGQPIPVHQLDADTAAAVASVDTRVGYRGDVSRKVRLWDKRAALELLGRHLGMWVDRPARSGSRPPAANSLEHLDDDKLRQIIALIGGTPAGPADSGPADARPA